MVLTILVIIIIAIVIIIIVVIVTVIAIFIIKSGLHSSKRSYVLFLKNTLDEIPLRVKNIVSFFFLFSFFFSFCFVFFSLLQPSSSTLE